MLYPIYLLGAESGLAHSGLQDGHLCDAPSPPGLWLFVSLEIEPQKFLFLSSILVGIWVRGIYQAALWDFPWLCTLGLLLTVLGICGAKAKTALKHIQGRNLKASPFSLHSEYCVYVF